MARGKENRRRNSGLKLVYSSTSRSAATGKAARQRKSVLEYLSSGTKPIWFGLLLIAIAAFHSRFDGSISGVLTQVLSGDSDRAEDTHWRHRFAARNCDAARSVGLAPAYRGQPGYYARHDADNDGIACEPWP